VGNTREPRHNSHVRGGNARIGCGPCRVDVGALHAIEAPRSLARAKGPRPQSNSDTDGGSAGPTPHGVAPTGALTAVAGASTTVVVVGTTPLVVILESAIL